MNIRLAKKEDLNELKKMYTSIVNEMNKNGIYIWNNYYPFEEFENDIENSRLYLLIDNNIICAAFALFDDIDGSDCFNWENNQSNALYISRLGVNVNFLRKGIGSQAIKYAKEICNKKNAEYLRLTVVNDNMPAISLYIKNGFNKVTGMYTEYSASLDRTINEVGFEIKTH